MALPGSPWLPLGPPGSPWLTLGDEATLTLPAWSGTGLGASLSLLVAGAGRQDWSWKD